jgi:hypothetical protein
MTGFRELETTQKAAVETARSSSERVGKLGVAYVRFACRNPQLYRLMFGVGMRGWRNHPGLPDAMKAAFDPLRTALGASSAAKPPAAATIQIAAVTAWSLVHGLAMLLIDGALEVPADSDQARAITRSVTAWLVAGMDAAAQPASGGSGRRVARRKVRAAAT